MNTHYAVWPKGQISTLIIKHLFRLFNSLFNVYNNQIKIIVLKYGLIWSECSSFLSNQKKYFLLMKNYQQTYIIIKHFRLNRVLHSIEINNLISFYDTKNLPRNKTLFI